MGYKINLGSWGSVFAVPSDVVDKYIKIAGGSSVKVLLYFLRHSGEDIGLSQAAEALCMKDEDVSDALIFWEQQGLLQSADDGYIPAAAANVQKTANYEQTAVPKTDNAVQLAAMRSAALRSPEFSPKQIADTIRCDDKIDHLFKVCEKMYGRPLKHAEQNALVTITDDIGMPAEVALMLVDYCFSVGRTSPAYMKTVAADWVEKDVITLSAAEEYVCRLQSAHSAENTVKSLFGIDRAMSQKEKEFSDTWINVWGFSPEMIKIAYDINVNSKGKCSFPYIGKILENWHEKGISTPEQASKEHGGKAPQDNSSLDLSDLDRQILEEYKKGD